MSSVAKLVVVRTKAELLVASVLRMLEEQNAPSRYRNPICRAHKRLDAVLAAILVDVKNARNTRSRS